MTQECAGVKAILVALQKSGLSSTARLIAVLESCGVVDTETLEALTESKPSTVREARRALKFQRQKSSAVMEIQRSDGNPAPEIQHFAGNPALVLEIQRQKSSSLACADITTCATNELPSVVVIPSEVSEVSEELSKIAKIAKPVKPKSQARGARLAKDWTLPDEWKAWTRATFPGSIDADMQNQADQFADYWRAKPGPTACKLDWEATWRNWCRRSLANGPLRPRAGTAGQPAQPRSAPWQEEKFAKQRQTIAWAKQAGLIP